MKTPTKEYTTAETAKAIGVSKKTLLRWLYAGELPEPRSVMVAKVESRVWSEEDLARAKQYRETHYRQKRSK